MGLVFVTGMEEYDDYHASNYDCVFGDLPKKMERRSRPSTSAAQLHGGESSVSVSTVEGYDDGLGRLRERPLHSKTLGR